MALDGTIANPRLILATSVEPIGFYYAARDGMTGLQLTNTQLEAFTPWIALLPKSRPQADPADSQYLHATWHLGAKGLRADIDWGADFIPTVGTTYVGFGRVDGNMDSPRAIFGYFKAI